MAAQVTVSPRGYLPVATLLASLLLPACSEQGAPSTERADPAPAPASDIQTDAIRPAFDEAARPLQDSDEEPVSAIAFLLQIRAQTAARMRHGGNTRSYFGNALDNYSPAAENMLRGLIGTAQEKESDSAHVMAYRFYSAPEGQVGGYIDIAWGWSAFINQAYGPLFQMPASLLASHPHDSLRDAEDYLTRLSKSAVFVAHISDKLHSDWELGWRPPKRALEASISRLQAFLEPDAHEHPLVSQFRLTLQANQALTQEERIEMAEMAADLVETIVYPAYRSIKEEMKALTTEAADAIGIDTQIGGTAFYRASLRRLTGTDLDAQQLHDDGVREVAGLLNALQSARQSLDSGAATKATPVIATDPSVTANAETTYTDTSETWHSLRQSQLLPLDPPIHWRSSPFPAQDLETGYKSSVQRYHQWQNAVYTAIPETAPPLLRLPSQTASVQGWPLFALRLAEKENSTAKDRITRLKMELLGAVRLVVDTGIHALNWDFAQAQEYFHEHTGYTAAAIAQELDYCIANPGRAGAATVVKMALRTMASQNGESESTGIEAAPSPWLTVAEIKNLQQ